MNDLNKKIASSQEQTAAVRIQPYKPYTDITQFGNRFMSPLLVIPPVSEMAWETPTISKTMRGVARVTAQPPPLVLKNGASQNRGNNSPGWRGY